MYMYVYLQAGVPQRGMEYRAGIQRHLMTWRFNPARRTSRALIRR